MLLGTHPVSSRVSIQSEHVVEFSLVVCERTLVDGSITRVSGETALRLLVLERVRVEYPDRDRVVVHDRHGVATVVDRHAPPALQPVDELGNLVDPLRGDEPAAVAGLLEGSTRRVDAELVAPGAGGVRLPQFEASEDA